MRSSGSSTLAFLCAFFALLALPQLAVAGQIVYAHSSGQSVNELWVMNEDGSGQHEWLNAYSDVPPSGSIRFVSLSEPEISADGRRVVFSTDTNVNQAPDNRSLGLFASGVNVWEAGKVRRLSPPPSFLEGVSSFEQGSAPASDGRIYYALDIFFNSGSTSTGSAGELGSFGADGSAANFGAACEDSGFGVYGVPQPNPVDPGLVVYRGCPDPGTGRDTIIVAHAGRADERIVRVAPESKDGYETQLTYPAWSPDGSRIVSIDVPGEEAESIVTYAADGSGGQTVLTAPAEVRISDPHYVGSDRIVFAAASGEGSVNIYSVAASCQSCGFANARQLTTDGASRSPSWSAAGLVMPPPAPPSPAPPKPHPAKGGPITALRKLGAKHGLALRIILSHAAKVKITVTGLKPKRKALSLTRKLKKGANTVKLRKVGKTKLRRGTYRVTVAVPGARGAKSLTVHVRP